MNNGHPGHKSNVEQLRLMCCCIVSGSLKLKVSAIGKKQHNFKGTESFISSLSVKMHKDLPCLIQ